MLFDRSWYNRAGVEKVMGFCTPEEYYRFMRQTPIFEQMLIDDGIMLRKYWFSVSDNEQLRRFKSRHRDPLRRWKLSPMDLESINRWEDYSRAKDEMMVHTDTPSSPWFVVESDIKKHARLNMIAHLLSSIPYTEVPPPDVELPKRLTSTSDYRDRLGRTSPTYPTTPPPCWETKKVRGSPNRSHFPSPNGAARGRFPAQPSQRPANPQSEGSFPTTAVTTTGRTTRQIDLSE